MMSTDSALREWFTRHRPEATADEPTGVAALRLTAADGEIRAEVTSCGQCTDGYASRRNADGYNVAVRCKCHNLAAIARRVNLAHLPAEHMHSSLQPIDGDSLHAFDIDRGAVDHRHLREHALESAIAFVDAVTERAAIPEHQHPKPTAPGLLLVGTAGLGKSHLMVGICRRLIRRGVTVRYRSWAQWTNEMWSNMTALRRDPRATILSPDETISLAARVPVLALDELGAGSSGSDGRASIERSWVEQLLKTRYDAGLPLLLASNYHFNAEASGALRVDETIVSRIRGRCDLAVLSGDDQRRRTK